MSLKVYLEEHGSNTVPNGDSASTVASDGHIGKRSTGLSADLVMEKVKVVI